MATATITLESGNDDRCGRDSEVGTFWYPIDWTFYTGGAAEGDNEWLFVRFVVDLPTKAYLRSDPYDFCDAKMFAYHHEDFAFREWQLQTYDGGVFGSDVVDLVDLDDCPEFTTTNFATPADVPIVEESSVWDFLERPGYQMGNHIGLRIRIGGECYTEVNLKDCYSHDLGDEFNGAKRPYITLHYRSCEPSLVTDKVGRTWLAYWDADPSPTTAGSAVKVYHRDGLDESWTAHTDAFTADTLQYGEYYGAPSITVQPDSAIFVAAHRLNISGEEYPVRMAKSVDDGSTWTLL